MRKVNYFKIISSIIVFVSTVGSFLFLINEYFFWENIEKNKEEVNVQSVIEELEIGLNASYLNDKLGSFTHLIETDCSVSDRPDCHVPDSRITKSLLYKIAGLEFRIFVDKNDTILAYTITNRSHKFFPKIKTLEARYSLPFIVELGKTKFSEIKITSDPSDFLTQSFFDGSGAQRWAYYLEYYKLYQLYGKTGHVIYSKSIDENLEIQNCYYGELLYGSSIEDRESFKKECPIQSVTILSEDLALSRLNNPNFASSELTGSEIIGVEDLLFFLPND